MGVPVRYMFTLEIENFDIQDDAAVERFYEDVAEAYLSARDGLVDATYVVEASEGEPCDAVLDAANHLRQLLPEVRVNRVTLDLVNITDIAARVNRSRSTVRSWATGSRGPGDFPRQISTLGGGVQVWHWPEVNDWLRLNHPDVADDERGIPLSQVERINYSLSTGRKRAPRASAVNAESGQWVTTRTASISVHRKSDLAMPERPYKSRSLR
ncbi:helix-turn-helix transcriptional regulator [Streptomyces sp. NPDC012389]|uniref:helix-turn-helix transcriptional regulator n=1 Tax=Streptomyces sp. NPDC012389 TaxID=3364830 RepID=UPI0036EB6812